LREEIAVAHHEAAHAVVGYILGGRLCRVILEGPPKNASGTWVGTAPIDCKGLPKEAVAKVSLAGPLAEAKVSASRERVTDFSEPLDSVLRSATLRHSCLSSVAKALRKSLGEESESAAAEVELEANGRVTTHRVFLCEACDDMTQVRDAIGDSENVVLQALREVRPLIDDSQVWQAVTRLAQELMKQQPRPFVRKELSGKMATHTIRCVLDAERPPEE